MFTGLRRSGSLLKDTTLVVLYLHLEEWNTKFSARTPLTHQSVNASNFPISYYMLPI
jgi:hypothetical protein